MQYGIYSADRAVEISQAVDRLSQISNEEFIEENLESEDFYFVKALEDIPGVESPIETPGTGDVVVVPYSNGAALVKVDPPETAQSRLCHNRGTDTIPEGTYFWAREIGPEFVPAFPVGLESGLESGSGSCCCDHYDTPDIALSNGLLSYYQFNVPLGEWSMLNTDNNLRIILPAGTYVVTKVDNSDTWEADLSSFLTAEDLEGNDATSSSTLSGSLLLDFDGEPEHSILDLTLDGTLTISDDGGVSPP